MDADHFSVKCTEVKSTILPKDVTFSNGRYCVVIYVLHHSLTTEERLAAEEALAGHGSVGCGCIG